MKQLLTTFFITLFLTTTVLPSVIVFVDDTFDVSCFFDVSEEEEEEKGKDKNKDLEVIVVLDHLDSDFFSAKVIADNLGYTFKKYAKPHLNLIFPPPQFTS